MNLNFFAALTFFVLFYVDHKRVFSCFCKVKSMEDAKVEPNENAKMGMFKLHELVFVKSTKGVPVWPAMVLISHSWTYLHFVKFFGAKH